MNYNKWIFELVPFDEVWNLLFENLICESFFEISKYPFGPNPETLWQLLCSKYDTDNYVLKTDNWEELECGKRKWDDQYFIDLLFRDFKSEEFQTIYIIIDNCFITKRALKINGENLLSFLLNSREIIEDYIFQGKDVIFISDQQFSMSFISHTGYFLSISNYFKMLQVQK